MRELSVFITTERGNVAEITITDNKTSEKKSFYVGGYNTDDEKAKQIGYEIISWAEIELKKEMEQ